MSERPTILEALRDPALLGSVPAIADLSTWRPWLVMLSALYGLPIAEEPDEDGAESDLEIFRRHTGCDQPREAGYHEAVVVTGRQSGKTQIAGLVGVYEAACAVLAGHRGVYVPLVAQDLRGAQRALYGYVREAVEASELLRGEVTRETSTELELSGRVTLGVYPCRPASVRGIRCACAVVDELAFFAATDGRPQDTEMLRAIRPTLATTGGRLIVLSSPYAQTGALYDLHRRHHGQDTAVLSWQATAPAMNPTLSPDYLERMEEEDPEAHRSEVLGEFRSGIATFLEAEALADVVEAGVREREPVRGVTYCGYVDAASGSGKDAFAVGIAHRDGERSVLDVVRAWRPPFNPSGVVEECAELLRYYGISRVSGDRYAPGFVAEGFRRHRVTYQAATRSTSDMYLEFLPLLNSGAVVLLDHPDTLRELRGLERRRGTSGRDRVDHRPGSHDDRAVAAAGALVAARRSGPRAGAFYLR